SLASGLDNEPFQLPQLLQRRVLQLQQTEDHLIERAVEDLMEKAARDLLATMIGRIDERSSHGAVPDQALLLHDAEQGLHGVEVEFALGGKALLHVAHAALARFPKDLEDFELAFAWSHVCHTAPPMSPNPLG